MEKYIAKTAGLDSHDYATGRKWNVYFYAEIFGSSFLKANSPISCGVGLFDNEASAKDAAFAWMLEDNNNDALAIELTDACFHYDPYCSGDYGDVLKSTVEMLRTPEGMRDIIKQQVELFMEATA